MFASAQKRWHKACFTLPSYRILRSSGALKTRQDPLQGPGPKPCLGRELHMWGIFGDPRQVDSATVRTVLCATPRRLDDSTRTAVLSPLMSGQLSASTSWIISKGFWAGSCRQLSCQLRQSRQMSTSPQSVEAAEHQASENETTSHPQKRHGLPHREV